MTVKLGLERGRGEGLRASEGEPEAVSRRDTKGEAEGGVGRG